MGRMKFMNDSLQYIRTNKAIIAAMMSLLEEKPFEKITVQDILDATPVTRATFYRHFHDKYEIVEKMQEDFFHTQRVIKEQLQKDKDMDLSVLAKSSSQNVELKEALLKVHTEKVDLWNNLSEMTRKNYLEKYDGVSEVEAKIYAWVITAYRLAADKKKEFSYEYMYEIFINVFLKLLRIEEEKDVQEVKKLLFSKLAKAEKEK